MGLRSEIRDPEITYSEFRTRNTVPSRINFDPKAEAATVSY